MSAKRRESRSARKSRSKAAIRARLLRRYRKLESFDCGFACAADEVVGIDEAGRGALAGPVVAAAVTLPSDSRLLGVDDSKVLSEDEREAIFSEIAARATAIGISFFHPVSIDRHNILNASLMAMAKAYENLRREAAVVLLDGRDTIHVPARVISVVGGDGKSLRIAAASIVAKVARDRVMRRLHERLPEYNFLQNKGYGTKDHLDAIDRHGMSVVHRKSYRAGVPAEAPTLF